MSNPAVLFVAVTTGLQCFLVHGEPAQEIDFRTILQLAEKQASRKKVPVADLESASNEEYNNRYGSLSSQEILDLIKKSTQTHNIRESPNRNYANKYKHDQEDDFVTYGNYNRHKELNENKLDDDYEYNVQNKDKYKDNDERNKHSRFNELALEELLTQNVLDKKYQEKPRKRVKPHNLVDSYDSQNDRSDNNKVGEYSKVYVILNPKAIEKSQNRDELNNLLVKILSLTASSLGREQGKNFKERRYKGFPVKTGLLTRRAKRDSREMFIKDSIEDDFRQKRMRNDRGGVGAGGRTAIPYIRHRGDIYERDN